MIIASGDLKSPGKRSTDCTLAEVLRQYGPEYLRHHHVGPTQWKALWAITHCRTAALGAQRYWCRRCGFERNVYHSCRNRHCPQCQTQASSAWAAARTAELLPVPYFHNVFTLPHQFNALVLYSERNRRALLNLLFEATSQTLMKFGRQELGGKIGFTLVLHTWDQQLRPHFHLHALLASGALSADGTRWIAGGAKFLFPVRRLSVVFRAKFLDGVARLLEEEALDLPPQLVHLSQPERRRAWLRRLRRIRWVVYSKPPFAGPQKLVQYLARYTHRVGISNHRILACDNGQVTFSWRDRGDGDRKKTKSLPAPEFIGRFLKHVLPDRLMRIRHYGLFANRDKRERLNHVRQLLGASPMQIDSDQSQTLTDWLREVLGLDIQQCPCCGSALERQQVAQMRPSIEPLHVRTSDYIDTS